MSYDFNQIEFESFVNTIKNTLDLAKFSSRILDTTSTKFLLYKITCNRWSNKHEHYTFDYTNKCKMIISKKQRRRFVQYMFNHNILQKLYECPIFKLDNNQKYSLSIESSNNDNGIGTYTIILRPFTKINPLDISHKKVHFIEQEPFWGCFYWKTRPEELDILS